MNDYDWGLQFISEIYSTQLSHCIRINMELQEYSPERQWSPNNEATDWTAISTPEIGIIIIPWYSRQHPNDTSPKLGHTTWERDSTMIQTIICIINPYSIINPYINPYHLSYSIYHWLVVWNIFYFSVYWECHHPNWRTHIFQRGLVNHQPDHYGHTFCRKWRRTWNCYTLRCHWSSSATRQRSALLFELGNSPRDVELSPWNMGIWRKNHVNWLV